jgi:site-specific DNA-methyltransferase (adenine-specific)
MQKGWDHGVPGEEFWREALRVAKPGAHLLAFGGTRTFHRLVCAIEDAGWEIRDTIMWVYGQGMPKSLNVAKAIDAKIQTGGSAPSNIRRRDMGEAYRPHRLAGTPGFGMSRGAAGGAKDRDRDDDEPIAPLVTEEARYWDGWGTALKPSVEPIVVARKPLSGTVADNVLKHGTGGINIDGCRVPHGDDVDLSMVQRQGAQSAIYVGGAKPGDVIAMYKPGGRWPANVIHDGSDEVLALFPEAPSAGEYKEPGHQKALGSRGADINTHLFQLPSAKVRTNTYAGQTGSAARFFYCAKPSKKDRDDGCENNHPTVKPTELMRYLCRLVTPPGGVVLDPFCGSGSTGRGAVLEGMSFVGIDLDAAYVEIARKRIDRVTQQED